MPALRITGFVRWPWAIVLGPFTLIGVIAAVVMTGVMYRDSLWAIRTRVFGTKTVPEGSTPAPDRLESPQDAVEVEPILVEHPEILAALCFGFRMKRLMPSVLGHPVSDPWGVYRAALAASPDEFMQLRLAAKLHTVSLAQAKRKDGGRVSDAVAMRAALDAFRPCAQKAEAGRGHPDCPFEHVTAIFGAESPNRDANLRSVAPRVRALLERQYPQLQTARLADGSQVKFVDWQQSATHDRAELSRLQRDRDRQTREVDQLRVQLAEEQARVKALADAADRHRRQAQEDARGEQAGVLAGLRAGMERADKDHARERQRLESEIAKLGKAVEALARERDALERTLLASADATDDANAAPASELTGIRVLLVGGEPRQIPPLRERLESLGAQLLHGDSVAAAEHVGHVNVVIFWIRYLSHPTYFGVRQKVRALDTPHAYWGHTSPGSLAALVAETIADKGREVVRPAAGGI